MKTVRLYWLPLLLLISSIYLINNTVDIKKDCELTKAKITIDKARLKTKEVGAYDVITAKQLIEAVSLRYKLPIKVDNAKNVLKLSIDSKDESAKQEILNKYEDLMGLLTTIAALPYRMKYDSFAYGKDCTGVFEASLSLTSNIN